MKKIFILAAIILTIFIPNISVADEQGEFQDMIRTILETGGSIKEITDTLRPNTRLYIYKQLPSMKKKIEDSEKTINDIKTKADEVITNRDLHTIVQDMASIQLLTIYVAKDLLEVYETNGAITQKDYNKVISKYEKQAKRLQKSLERYKNM